MLIRRKAKGADIRLRTDFNRFFKADDIGKRLLLLDNIIRSVKAIAGKSRSDFKAEKLINDIYELFEVDPKALEEMTV